MCYPGFGTATHHLKRILNISESGIYRHGVENISRWAYLRSRCPNGCVYGGYNDQRKKKLKWSRSKYFAAISALVEAGLARKDEHGNYILAKVKEVKGIHKYKEVKHHCTLLLTSKMTDRDVRDMVIMKLVEQEARQVLYKIVPKEDARSMAREERNRLNGDGNALHRARTMLLENPMLGQSRKDLVKLAKADYAPMNTEKLMKATGLGRYAMFAWKKRVKRKRWMKQKDRSEVIDSKTIPLVLRMTRETEELYRGKVTYSPSLGVRFTQASAYRMKIKY